MRIKDDFMLPTGKFKDSMVIVEGAYHELTRTNPYIQHVSFKCPGMNGSGGDQSWKEKLHLNNRKFKSRQSPDGQKRLSCICKAGFDKAFPYEQECSWYQGSKGGELKGTYCDIR